jgi:hypothetical protein
MFGVLSRLFGGPDALTRACRDMNRRAFAELLGRSSVAFLSLPAPFDQGLDPSTMSQEELFSLIEQAAQDLSERKEFQPFCYTVGQAKYLPLFSQEKFAQQFVGEYARKVNRVIPFQMLTANGAALVPAFSNCDIVVLNDRTKHRHQLSAEDIALLREVWAEPDATDVTMNVKPPSSDDGR